MPINLQKSPYLAALALACATEVGYTVIPAVDIAGCSLPVVSELKFLDVVNRH